MKTYVEFPLPGRRGHGHQGITDDNFGKSTTWSAALGLRIEYPRSHRQSAAIARSSSVLISFIAAQI
jgi:hypothetical protein